VGKQEERVFTQPQKYMLKFLFNIQKIKWTAKPPFLKTKHLNNNLKTNYGEEVPKLVSKIKALLIELYPLFSNY
jgi:hypothetical protein